MSYSNLKGTVQQQFQIGLDGTKIANDLGDAKITDQNDNLANLSVKDPSSPDHAATKRYVKRRLIKISASFDGNSAPAAGTNTGKYLICHTSGGSYVAGKIYYDDGTALTLVEDDNRVIYVACPDFSGTISLKEKYVYMWDEELLSWIALFDTANVFDGTDQIIILDIGTNSSYESTTTIPSNAYITNTRLKIADAYDIGTTIEVKLKNSGVILLASNHNKASKANEEFKNDELIKMTQSDTVLVNIAGTPTVGSGFVMVEFTIPLR